MPLTERETSIEQCEPESAFLDDVSKLVSFVNMYNNTLPEYIRVARMYLFGTPIRRTGAAFRQATPGCIRLKLYSSQQDEHYGSEEAVVDDVVDFPLGPNGDLDFERIKLWWGVKICAALEPYSWKVFRHADPNKISGIAIHNLTAGRQNAMDLLYVPTETDEYKREEQGTWTRELKWHRRMVVYEPAWYFNRLLALCALFWLFSLIPDAFATLKYAVIALEYTVVALKSAATALTFTLAVAARRMRELDVMIDHRAPGALLRSLL